MDTAQTAPNRAPNAAALLEATQAHALALAMYNAANMQQQNAVVRQAVTVMACSAILSFGSSEVAATAKATAPPSLAGDDSANPPSSPPTPSLAATLADTARKLPPPAAPMRLPEDGGVRQIVAQSTALALQDAADFLRGAMTIAVAANGAALAQLVANPQSTADYAHVEAATEQFMAAALASFEAIAASSENILKRFPRD